MNLANAIRLPELPFAIFANRRAINSTNLHSATAEQAAYDDCARTGDRDALADALAALGYDHLEILKMVAPTYRRAETLFIAA